MEICQSNISKGVDDFLEVTIIDKGDKEEKQKIGRCVKVDLFTTKYYLLFSHFDPTTCFFQNLDRPHTVDSGEDPQLVAQTERPGGR